MEKLVGTADPAAPAAPVVAPAGAGAGVPAARPADSEVVPAAVTVEVVNCTWGIVRVVVSAWVVELPGIVLPAEAPVL